MKDAQGKAGNVQWNFENRTVETQATADDTAWGREQRQRLKQSVAEVFQRFAPDRERRREEQSAGKVGRNEPRTLRER